MRSELRERPAVYPAFALRATRRSSSLEDQTSSFSTDDVDVWRYAAVCCMPETTINVVTKSKVHVAAYLAVLLHLVDIQYVDLVILTFDL